ncbi:MAG: SRPBCC family protein [Deltaproteobacteria bacterium]|nr:SRPBCC family protein [Deltaproteobacteria bacterium]
MVRAPVARVREAVLAFPRYPEFMPHYRSARELGPGREAVRQVYMEVTALHGALRMWAQVEVLPVEVAGGVEIHRTAFVRGNVRDFQAVWRLRPIDENRTELTLEVFLHPRLPLPTSVLNAENVEGATKGVLAVKRRVEQSSG